MIKRDKSYSFIKKTALGVSAAALISGLLWSSGQMYASALESYEEAKRFESFAEQIHGTTSTLQAIASKSQSNTQDGITLTVKDVKHDGRHIEIELGRSGGSNLSKRFLGEPLPDGRTDYSKKGVLDDVEVYINGELYRFENGSLWPGKDANSVILKYGNAKDWSNPKSRTSKLIPDKFELTIKATLSKVKKPFIMKVPVQGKAKSTIVSPNITKSYDDFELTLEQMEVSSLGTYIHIVGMGDIKDLPQKYRSKKGELNEGLMQMDFDILDEKGYKVKGSFLFDLGGAKAQKEGVYQFNYVYSPFKSTPKTITIKPYLFDISDPKKGKVDKKYIPELEYKVSLSNS
ncbi:DUF5643 domain-containing protein [Paenibacillus agilis]|uniref:DUF5643 domain-containing protein n=1 Tax=Paenibacillus agilis TaxID=3020863 RepID=A0A559J1B3_9BACL|nr:DUF5643 domain-containing protein [Paenibacillus agilis]TVX93631.1 hypothetical protein FPZ44_11515 [Paenibacillus agilis]